MAHLMFQSCCYSWFVKGTWRVSYCAGKAREKLSCKCSATNISPFQGCLPSAASHFQDSVLKGKVPGQYCSTLVFSKAFHWVRYQIKTEDARIRVEHLEVLPKSQGGKHFSDSSPKKKKKVQGLSKGTWKIYHEARTHPRRALELSDIPNLTISSILTLLFCFFFSICMHREGQRRVFLFFKWGWSKSRKACLVLSNPFFYLPLFFLLPACSNDNTLRDLHLCAGAGEVLQA